MTRHLADSSIWSWANSGRRADIQEKLAERYERGAIVTCAPVILETMHRPRTGAEYERTYCDVFEPLERLPIGENVAERALKVQRELAATTHGNHMRPAIDYLIAAIAEAAGNDTTLWFLDKDLRVICEHTGQPFEAES